MAGIWDYLKYFKVNERSESGGNAWGDYTKMNGLLLRILDEIREEAGASITVHCGYELREGSNSEHRRGNAVDFHFNKITPAQGYRAIIKVLTKYNLLNRYGLGYYSWWIHRGFHLDLRGYKCVWLSTASLKYTYDEAKMKAALGVQ